MIQQDMFNLELDSNPQKSEVYS
uniref:Uncharacterized protein n=1 Tax=Rhizophora mucronata TaxID=61149 RepID=A0A2P2R3F0_RHIMU